MYVRLKKKLVIEFLIIAILALLTQIFYWNIFFGKLIKHQNTKFNKNQSTLTILICAKNEAENLENLIADLTKEGVNSKILVVDDFSIDDSISILDAYANKFSQVKYISSSIDRPGKKQALMDGLKVVKDDLVLLTDADCRPASSNWPSLMSSALRKSEIVLGFSPYKKSRGFLNLWIRYEAILTAIQYLSFALNGRPYMGVGRNLLYKKSLIRNGELLEENIDLASGDDDLLINRLANKANTSIQIDPNAWVFSAPKKSWRAYFRQKRRHMSTASSYKFSDQLSLILFSVSWILFYFLIIVLFCKGLWIYGLILLIIRLLTSYLSVIPLFLKLNGKDCIIHWWYLDPITALYFLIFSIFAIIPQRNKW